MASASFMSSGLPKREPSISITVSDPRTRSPWCCLAIDSALSSANCLACSDGLISGEDASSHVGEITSNEILSKSSNSRRRGEVEARIMFTRKFGI